MHCITNNSESGNTSDDVRQRKKRVSFDVRFNNACCSTGSRTTVERNRSAARHTRALLYAFTLSIALNRGGCPIDAPSPRLETKVEAEARVGPGASARPTSLLKTAQSVFGGRFARAASNAGPNVADAIVESPSMSTSTANALAHVSSRSERSAYASPMSVSVIAVTKSSLAGDSSEARNVRRGPIRYDGD